MTTSLSNITVKDGQNTLVVKANDITINGSSILATNNFVTLDTAQTITGGKTFTSRMRFTQQSPTIRNNNDDWSTAPAEQIYYQWGCEDKNGIWLGGFEGNHLTDGSYIKGMYVRQQNGSGYAHIIVGIRPDGSVWTSAPTPATSDNSTKIATTAFVKNQGYLTSHQSLANYVTLNSAQTITASKTLQVGNDDAWLIKKANGDYTEAVPEVQVQGNFRVVDKNNKIMGDLRIVRTTDGTQVAQLLARNAVTGSEVNCVIGCYVDKNGNIWTLAPTPATSDNSTKIATTAYCNNKHQVVSALPASPDANVFYYIPA